MNAAQLRYCHRAKQRAVSVCACAHARTHASGALQVRHGARTSRTARACARKSRRMHGQRMKKRSADTAVIFPYAARHSNKLLTRSILFKAHSHGREGRRGADEKRRHERCASGCVRAGVYARVGACMRAWVRVCGRSRHCMPSLAARLAKLRIPPATARAGCAGGVRGGVCVHACALSC